MTDAQEQAENVTTAKLARLERLCGRFPVLSSENRQDYEELLISLLEHHTPRNFLGERLIRFVQFVNSADRVINSSMRRTSARLH